MITSSQSLVEQALDNPKNFDYEAAILKLDIFSSDELMIAYCGGSRRGFNKGYKQAINDVINLLMIQHEAAKSGHNYWHVAANLVSAEFLPEKKNS